MSARQRFVANGKSASKQNDDTGAEATVTSGIPAAPDKHNSNSAPVLKDAPNSPRPGRRTASDNVHSNKNNDDSDMTSSTGVHISNAILAAAGIDKPLNIGSLARPKPKKTGDPTATPSQNKKHRNSTIDRLKENEVMSRCGSPKALPMSPSRRLQSSVPPSFLFGSSNATLLSDNQPMSPTSRHNKSTYSSDVPTVHMSSDGRHSRRIPVSAGGSSFAASGHTLMNAFSPSASRPYHDPLEPARREVFPVRTNSDGPTDPAHTCDSLSPPTPAQRRFSEERTYDYQAPVILDEGGVQADDDNSQKHDQHLLRRTTKRIGQHGTEEDEAAYGREGKRTKLDMHTKQVTIEQRTNVEYEQRRARPSRSSTPVHRYHSPAQSHTYNTHPHQAQPIHSHPEAHAQKPSQPTPPAPLGEDNQVLCRFLGIDLERYVSEHIKQYEAAKKRWTGCSIEEWQAGANEISGKFSKLVDFAKDHMTTKLTLYASLHDKVAQHKVVLGERQSMLKNMQEKLVKDSGMVLGGSGGNTT